MENILLTGASGMVGKSILKIFKKENFIIFSPKRYNLNLSNIDKVKKYILKRKITSVIHAAGLVGGIQDNIDYPHSYLLKNSLINLSLIEAARITKIKKLIFIGSSCMYPKNINRPIEEEDLLKSPLENTNEGYAISKIFGYKLCEYSNKQHKTKFKTIVSTNLFGENDKFDGNKAHLVSAILQKVFDAKRKKEKKIEIWGDGKARRDFIHVDELSKFILFSINNYKKIPELINFGSGKDFTINQYYKKIFKILKVNVKFKNNLKKPSGMKRKLLSIKKLKKIRYNLNYNFEKRIKDTFKNEFIRN
jgi:GDP-L-fucose synthase